MRVVVNTGSPAPRDAAARRADGSPLPNVVGEDYDDALGRRSTAAGFTVTVRYVQQSSEQRNDRRAGAAPPDQLAQGSAVTITLSVSGEVPDTVGMTRR